MENKAPTAPAKDEKKRTKRKTPSPPLFSQYLTPSLPPNQAAIKPLAVVAAARNNSRKFLAVNSKGKNNGNNIINNNNPANQHDDQPSDDIVDVVTISSTTSFASSSSTSSRSNVSPVVSSFGMDYIDTLLEEMDADVATSGSSTPTAIRHPSPIMPCEQQQQQQQQQPGTSAVAAATAAAAVVATAPAPAAAAPPAKENKKAINAGLKRKSKMQPKRVSKRQQHAVPFGNSPESRQAFIEILKTLREPIDPRMFETDYGFGDDDPAYYMSDPDISINDLSCSSSSSSDDSWQSTSEIEEIADASMEADKAIQATKIMPAPATLEATNKNNNNNNNNAPATTVFQNGGSNNNNSSSNNNNNNNSKQASNTPSGLENFFRQQNELWEKQKEQQQQQQKWNLVKSTKIPTLFLPKVDKIQPILDRLNGLDGVANGYTTKCTQNGAIRVHCKTIEVYNKISQELNNNNAELHTHQMRKDRGYKQQQPQQKHQKQQPPIKGNNNSRPTQLSYSQVAKSGNTITPSKREATGPASRHLHTRQKKLQTEQQKEQQQQQQAGQQTGQQQHQVAISLESGESLILAPIYCPPQPTWTEQQFIQLLEHLHKLGNNNSNSSSHNRPGLL
ncbi:hypothetical protein ACLKA6_017319, partial [Drosophila palustris]